MATISTEKVVNGALKGTAEKKPTKASKTSTTASSKRKRPASTVPNQATNTEREKTSEKAAEQNELEFAVPTTPTAKRRRNQSAKALANPPPTTPAPSGARLMTSETPVPLPDNVRLKARPAEPHATNAPLSTPGGSRVVAYSSSPVKHSDDVSPTKKTKEANKVVPVGPPLGMPAPTSTTETLLKDACAHLVKVDPKLKVLIDKHHCKMFSPEGLMESVDPFMALASGIIGQQVSGAAAASIKNKFISLFPSAPAFPAPSIVAATSLETLRTAGLSQRKAEYIQGLAEKFASEELSARMLVSASDEEVMEKLIAVRGLGRWSVEMFACFSLKRMDIFSTGDLGVQRGMAAYMGKDVSKLKGKGGKWKYMSEQDMVDISARFSPYRSLFMWYMWRVEDVDISVMQGN